MTDSRAGGTRLLVTTMLAAVAVGAVLVIDAYMQDDLQEPIASISSAGTPEAPSGDDDARLDPEAACWGPFLPPVCLPPLLPHPDAVKEETALNEPIADEPVRPRKPRQEALPDPEMPEPNEVGISDQVFASVIDSWHAPKACATAVGDVTGT